MNPQVPVPLERLLRALLIAAGLAGLLIQVQVSGTVLAARGLGTAMVVLKLASYFTILTNLLLVLCHGICLLLPASRAARKLAGPAVQGALLLYIGIVGLVYVTVLARLWDPQGAHWWADRLLHHATPALQLVFWFLAVPKARLPWQTAAAWLLYPLLYLAWVFLRSTFSPDFPYPFLDAAALGLPRTLLNCLLLACAFAGGGLLLIAAGRLLAGTRKMSDSFQGSP